MKNCSILGVYNSSFFLGCSFGPTIAGITIEYYGFQATTVGFLATYLLILLLNIFESASIFSKKDKKIEKHESSERIGLINSTQVMPYNTNPIK